MDHSEKGRRDFLKSLALGAAGAAMLTPQSVQAAAGGTLQVWSCGGLAEAMMPVFPLGVYKDVTASVEADHV